MPGPGQLNTIRWTEEWICLVLVQGKLIWSRFRGRVKSHALKRRRPKVEPFFWPLWPGDTLWLVATIQRDFPTNGHTYYCTVQEEVKRLFYAQAKIMLSNKKCSPRQKHTANDYSHLVFSISINLNWRVTAGERLVSGQSKAQGRTSFRGMRRHLLVGRQPFWFAQPPHQYHLGSWTPLLFQIKWRWG